MSSEAAKVIIDADDRASKKLAIAADNAERNIKAIKDAGGKAKASVEFFGVLASTLGGSELASYAGQLGQITEKVGQFSEVSKAGQAGSLAFKAGLAGLVATVSFGFGKAIGDAVFQTAEFEKQLEKATAKAEKLNSAILETTRTSFAGQVEQIEVIRDPEEQQKALEGLLSQLDKNITAKNSQITALEKQISEVDDTWSGYFSKVSGDVRAINEANKVSVQELEKQKEPLNQQALELRNRLSSETAALELKKQQNALAEKSEGYIESLRQELELLKASKDEAIAIEAARNTFGDADSALAEQLMRERDALLEKREAEKLAEEERKRAVEQAAADSKRLADLKQSEIDKLKEQRIELTQGSEAARAFALQRQGLDEATARSIAREQEELDKLREQRKPGGERTGGSFDLSVSDSRLMTRGRTADQGEKIAQYSKQTAEELAKLNRREERKVQQMQSPVVLKLGTA